VAARAGFSIVELMIAVVVLAIAVCGLSSSILSSMVLNRVNRETTVAQQAAREMLEQIHGEEFGQAFFAFNATVGDYGGLDVERGPGFAVPGLDVRTGDPDGLAGRVVFPTIDVLGAEQLREDVVDAALGLPRDLDGDGVIGTDDVSGDYILLPVRIVVEWRGVRGDRQLTLESVLSLQ
jgi:prepilin-type N-terminal cleavage/methylation domain-containing protein